MSLSLTFPTLWWSRGRLRMLHGLEGISDYERSLLLRLRRITVMVPLTSYDGDSMSDDTSTTLRLLSPPAEELVTLAQAKAFLRIEHAADDDAITVAIAAAQQAAEHYLRVCLLPQSWNYRVANYGDVRLALPVGPATSIDAVTLTNEQEVSAAMDADLYRLSVDGYSVLFTNAPSTEVLSIDFTVGAYGRAADVPALIVQGMLHHVATMMESRDGTTGLPMQSISCYAPFRRISL